MAKPLLAVMAKLVQHQKAELVQKLMALPEPEQIAKQLREVTAQMMQRPMVKPLKKPMAQPKPELAKLLQ